LAARKFGRVFRPSRCLCINKRCARDKNHCAPSPRPLSFPPAPRACRGIPIPCVTAICRCRGGRFVGAVRNMLQMKPALPHDQTIAVARWRRQWPPVAPTQAGEPSQKRRHCLLRPRTPAIARRARGGCCCRCVTRKRQWALGGPLRRLRSVLSDCARRRLRGTVRVGGDRRASKYNALPLRLHRFIHPVFVVVVVDDERLSAQRSLTAAWRARSTVVTAKTAAIRAPQRPGQLPVGRPSWQRNWAPDTAIPPRRRRATQRLPLSSKHRRR